MKIAKMTLKKYRNYDNLEVSFNDNLNIIIGDNAQGKTNLLESIYVLGVTRSFLSGNDRNLIKFENKASLIKGEVITNDGKFNLEVLINENGKVVKVNSKEIKKYAYEKYDKSTISKKIIKICEDVINKKKSIK